MTNQGRHRLDVAHAVDAHREEVVLLKGADKLQNVLSQHVMSVGSRYREAHHDRHFRRDALGFLEGDACVLRVKDGLYQQHIDTSVHQCLYLFRIRLAQRGSKLLFVFSLLTDEGLARRAYASCHKTRFLRGGIFLGTLACYLDSSQVDFPARVLQTEVAHGDALGIKRICLDDVGTRLQVFAMDVANHKGSRQREHVIAPFQVVAVVSKADTTEIFLTQPVLLNHGAHSTVEHEDTVGGERFGFARFTSIT